MREEVDLDFHIAQEVLVAKIKSSELNQESAPIFKKLILEEMANHKMANVVLDLKELHAIDTSGIGALLAVAAEANEIKLAGVCEPVRLMLQTLLLEDHFEIFYSAAEAIASYNR